MKNKTFTELTALALAARQTHTPRSDFLASVSPDDRSNAAMQFDRVALLETEQANPATAQEINAEARRIAVADRLARHCEQYSSYGPELLSRILSGRIMSDGMKRESETARAYSEQVTSAEIDADRSQAVENLNAHLNYLAARLGVTS